MELKFFHLRDTTNIGDRWCSPFDHIDWSKYPKVNASVQDIMQPSPDYDFGIFGGGKILRSIAKSPAWRPRFNAAWGISTAHRNPFSMSPFLAKRRLNLIGSRDWDGRAGLGGYDWVPCASSEHPFFDAPPPPRHSVVVYAHKLKSKSLSTNVPDGIPMADNHSGDFLDALAFIASGETVVSNSYHGVFWALLMGRKVLCAPFNNKFLHYRLPPGYTAEADWAKNLHLAAAAPELLDLCREATRSFERKIVDHIARLSFKN